MDNNILLEKLKKNILAVGMSTDDAPYFGVNKDVVKGINFAIDKILEGTGITIQSLLEKNHD